MTRQTSTSSSESKFDLIVIGSGPGGQKAALQGAKAGKKVAIVEDCGEVGGGCVQFGTLPSKSFRESVYRFSLGSQGMLAKENTRATAAKIPEMKRLLQRKERVVFEESRVIRDQLERNGVKIYLGRAAFTSPYEVEVSERSQEGEFTGKKRHLVAEFIVIAVGATPVTSDQFGLDGQFVLDSNTVLNLEHVPKRMIVLGAGIIGCEYASMFSMAGTEVVLVDKRKEMLASVDREIVAHLVERYRYQGMQIHLGVEAASIVKHKKGAKGHSVDLTLTDGTVVHADCVLVAQGRVGNTKGLGLEKAGLSADERGLLKVNRTFQTDVPHIYAVGDVIGPPALASTSMEQGRIATCHAFRIPSSLIAGNHPGTSDSVAEMSTLYPYGIYTIPEISMIGRTEEELIRDGVEFVAGKARYRELARGQIVGDFWGLLKMLVDKKTARILGVHIVGDNAADLIHIGQAVMAFGGTAHYFIQSVFNYPTLAEAYKTAAFHAVNLMQGTTKSR